MKVWIYFAYIVLVLTTCSIIVHGDEQGSLVDNATSSTSSSNNDDDNSNEQQQQEEEQQQCGLYLAISTVVTELDEDEEDDEDASHSPKTNWGIFAGKDYAATSHVGYPDVAINVHNFALHGDDSIDNTDEYEFYNSLFWVPEIVSAGFELQHNQPGQNGNVALPGFGMLSVDKSELTNAKLDTLAAFRRPLQGETSGVSYPGRGSSSQFYHQLVQATREIKPGHEIFLHAGDPNLLSNADDDQDTGTGDTLSPTDIEKIDELIQQLYTYFTKYESVLSKDDRIQMYKFLIKDVLYAAVGTGKITAIAQRLPEDPDELVDVLKQGGIMAYSYKAGYRDLSWLQEHGLCMDNIRSGPSTIPNAGRGAFATRSIPAGSLVAPVPLLHFLDSSIFNMYELKKVPNDDDNDNDDDDETNVKYVRASDTVIGKQLLYNYVYGHPESSMVFFPSGAVVGLINHSSEPNAKMVWSKHPKHNSKLFLLNPDDDDNALTGIEPYELVIEIIATRDIKPNEEIYIDYGSQWVTAWDDHVQEWQKRIDSGDIPKEWPIRAVDLNHRYNTTKFETYDEIKALQGDNNNINTPFYPTNVQLHAFIITAYSGYEGTITDPYPWSTDEYKDGTIPYLMDRLLPITILKRKDPVNVDGTVNDYSYTVRGIYKQQTIHVTDVPHHAIVFIDRPGTSDQFVTKPFRHYIGIPDDIFPQGPWRNLIKEE